MKILIRATNWVGDAIMALPAIRAVRSRFPEAEIAILARPYVADIYRDQAICNQLISYDSQAKHAGILGRERLAAELRSLKFDRALLLQNAFDAAWLVWRAYYLSRMPTLGRKVRIFVEWTWGMFFPNDITHLRFTRSADLDVTR